MTWEIALLLGLLALATAAFASEWLSVDLVTLLLLSCLVVTGILSAKEAFAGFANEILVILGSIFVLSAALTRTRVLDRLGHALARLSARSESRALFSLGIVAAGLSAFLNNTNVTALLLPPTLEVSRRTELSSSRLLIPLAYASMLGGTCTLIGTSTNVAASGLLVRLGLDPYSLFELAAVGVVVAAVGIGLMATVGYRLLPDRPGDLRQQYRIDRYLSSVSVREDSPLADTTLGELRLTDLGLTVLAIERSGRRLLPGPLLALRPNDLLILHGGREALLRARQDPRFELEAETSLEEEAGDNAEAELREAILMPQSPLIGRSLRELHFRQRFDLNVLALYRRGPQPAADMRNLPLHVGDVLLLQGDEPSFDRLADNGDLWLLGEVDEAVGARWRGWLTLAALALAILLGVSGWLPLSIALLLGAIGVVLAGAVKQGDLYSAIDWRLLILIGGMLSVGSAMQETGAAEWLAQGLIEQVMPLGIYAVMAALVLLTMLLTQPLSNAAAVLVVLPIAVATAAELDANPRTFAVLVTLSASLSFLTPLEPACLLVYGPGHYRFFDFLKLGIPLSAVAAALLLLLVPRFWPL